MKVMLIAVGLVLVVVGAALAQTAAPTPHALELGRQMAVAQSGEGTTQALVDKLTASLSAGEVRRLPLERKGTAQDMRDAVAVEVPGFVGKLLDTVGAYYATEFTEAQLTEALAAPDSPSGKAVVAAEPRLAPQMQAYAATHIPQLMVAVVERYCAKTACTAVEKKAILAAPLAGLAPPEGAP